MYVLSFKLKRLKGSVKDWEQSLVLAKAKEISEIDSAILHLLSASTSGILNDSDVDQLTWLNSKKESLLSHQVLIWKLKRRIDWLKEGDANTKFFTPMLLLQGISKLSGHCGIGMVS